MLVEFGPSSNTYRPEEPFVRLMNDGIWQLDSPHDRRNPSNKLLLEHDVKGGFTSEVNSLLIEDSRLVTELAEIVLHDHFPETLHDDILRHVGLDLLYLSKRRKRDPDFRNKILQAYEHRCAVCGFNVRLGNQLVGIEAAHIKWHQAGGPDIEENGIALCSMHHKLFDRGVFTITNSSELIVSESAHGSFDFEEWLMRYHGSRIKAPINPNYEYSYTDWHVKEVFKGPGRCVSLG